MQSVFIITKVVSSNHTYGEVYSIQPYEIKLVSEFEQVVLFSDNLAYVLGIFTLQDMHNMSTLSINIQSICTAAKQCRKNHCFTIMLLKLLHMNLYFFPD
jgi:Tfp pilus assembly protein PilO